MSIRSRMQLLGVTVAVFGLVAGTGCKKKHNDATSTGDNGPPASTTPPPPPHAAPNVPPPSNVPGTGPRTVQPDQGWERFTNSGADNQVDVPKDWTHKPVDESLIIVSPDKQIFIELSASLAMGKDKADERKLMARLERSLQHVKRVGPVTKASQNGLTGWKFAGTASKGGRAYDWESFALEDAAGKGAFGLVYASTADLAAHRAIIEKILGSVSAVTH